MIKDAIANTRYCDLKGIVFTKGVREWALLPRLFVLLMGDLVLLM